jgi:hypothetical protein
MVPLFASPSILIRPISPGGGADDEEEIDD